MPRSDNGHLLTRATPANRSFYFRLPRSLVLRSLRALPGETRARGARRSGERVGDAAGELPALRRGGDAVVRDLAARGRAGGPDGMALSALPEARCRALPREVGEGDGAAENCWDPARLDAGSPPQQIAALAESLVNVGHWEEPRAGPGFVAYAIRPANRPRVRVWQCGYS